jgi:hypothetical protein
MNCKYKNHHYIVLWEIKIFLPYLITRFLSLHLESRATPRISASNLINKSECVSVCLLVCPYVFQDKTIYIVAQQYI